MSEEPDRAGSAKSPLLAASDQPAEKTVKVVTALGDICRDTLGRTPAQEQIGQRMAELNHESGQHLLDQRTLRVDMESLVKQDAGLVRLVREVPNLGGRWRPRGTSEGLERAGA